MSYEVTIKEATLQALAAIQARASTRNLGELITRHIPQVWQFVTENAVENNGRSAVVYHGEEGDDIFSDEGMPIEIGVQVLGGFEDTDAIRHSAVPGGRVARTLHIGPYQDLPNAHNAVRQWCEENGHTISGLGWEDYGPYHDDPAELETQVCYLLR